MKIKHKFYSNYNLKPRDDFNSNNISGNFEIDLTADKSAKVPFSYKESNYFNFLRSLVETKIQIYTDYNKKNKRTEL